MAEIKWTKHRPDKPGYFWAWHPGQPPRILEFVAPEFGPANRHPIQPLNCIYTTEELGEFAGPIPVPTPLPRG